jgi:hypothetical protein
MPCHQNRKCNNFQASGNKNMANVPLPLVLYECESSSATLGDNDECIRELGA